MPHCKLQTMDKYLSLAKSENLCNVFMDSHFNYVPTTWMFFSQRRYIEIANSAVLYNLHALRPHVPMCLACLRAHVPYVLYAYMLTCQRAMRAYVLLCLRDHIPKCPPCLCAHMPMCLACSHAHVLTCLTCSQANVSCVSR